MNKHRGADASCEFHCWSGGRWIGSGGNDPLRRPEDAHADEPSTLAGQAAHGRIQGHAGDCRQTGVECALCRLGAPVHTDSRSLRHPHGLVRAVQTLLRPAGPDLSPDIPAITSVQVHTWSPRCSPLTICRPDFCLDKSLCRLRMW